MKDKTMSLDVFAAWVGGFLNAAAALVKALGLKAVLGAVGAAMLFFAAPPERPDGSFSRHEFVTRLAFSGLFCVCFGDWLVDVVGAMWPWLQHNTHRNALLIATAAPGWYVTRWAALWLYARRDRDASDVVREVKGLTNGNVS